MSKERLASSRMYIAAFSALTAAASAGCVISWSGCAFTGMEDDDSVPYLNTTRFPEDEEMKSWLGSSIALGALFGSILCSFIVKLFGTRKTLICVGVPVFIGWTIIFVARSLTVLLIARFLLGLCLGITTTSAPAYVSDIVTPSTRGFLGSCFQLILCVGQVFIIGFGCFLNWKLLSIIGIIPAILCSFGMFFFGVESPFELIEDGRDDDAEYVLNILRKYGSDTDDELMELRLRAQQNQQMSKMNSSPFSMFSRRDVWMPTMITVMLMFFQQFSGINAVMFYLSTIFEEAVPDMNPLLCSLYVSFALVAATFASGLFMDFFGRKLLLNISGAGHVITLGLMGLFYADIGLESHLIPVACLVLFVIFFSFGYGPIPWMIAGEITPAEAKPMVSSIGSTVNWLCAFLTTKFFVSLESVLKQQGAYWFFGVCSAVSIVFVQFVVPETKHKSIRDIQNYFLSR